MARLTCYFLRGIAKAIISVIGLLPKKYNVLALLEMHHYFPVTKFSSEEAKRFNDFIFVLIHARQL